MGREVKIDSRKLVKSGYSLQIVLPIGFCKAHGWTAGDAIVVKTDGKRLILEKEG